jgi:hypothetical protein
MVSNPRENEESSSYKPFSKEKPKEISAVQTTHGKSLETHFDAILQKVNRLDFPIVLDPKTATFDEVAIHALLRQRIAKGTIARNLRYARFMETHPCPVNFRNPSYENFIRHMDYREQIEESKWGALKHEWQAMRMFLKAYGNHQTPGVIDLHRAASITLDQFLIRNKSMKLFITDIVRMNTKTHSYNISLHIISSLVGDFHQKQQYSKYQIYRLMLSEENLLKSLNQRNTTQHDM